MKDFGVIAKHFYDDLHTYMSNWTNWITPLTSFSWSNLKSQIHLDSVVTSAVEINKMQSNQQIQIDNLTEQVQRINAYLDDNIVVWNRQSKSASFRWVEVLENVPNIADIATMINFIFALPGTNAVCERLFSEINYFWNKTKSRLQLQTVKMIMQIRYNITRNCEDVTHSENRCRA